MYGVNASDGARLWRRETANWVQASPALHAAAGLAVVGNWAGVLYGLDAATGAVRWSNAAAGAGAIWGAAVIDAAGRAYVGTQGGLLLCVDARSGETQWALPLDGALEASAVVAAAGALLVATGNGTVQLLH